MLDKSQAAKEAGNIRDHFNIDANNPAMCLTQVRLPEPSGCLLCASCFLARPVCALPSSARLSSAEQPSVTARLCGLAAAGAC